MMANEMVQNHLILLSNVNVLHTFQNVKSYVFNGHFASSSIQTVNVFKTIRVRNNISSWNLCHDIEER